MACGELNYDTGRTLEFARGLHAVSDIGMLVERVEGLDVEDLDAGAGTS